MTDCKQFSPDGNEATISVLAFTLDHNAFPFHGTRLSFTYLPLLCTILFFKQLQNKKSQNENYHLNKDTAIQNKLVNSKMQTHIFLKNLSVFTICPGNLVICHRSIH